MRCLITVLALSLASYPLAAQDSSVAEPAAPVAAPKPPSPAVLAEIHVGDSLETALQPDSALTRFRAALALDETNYDALWKAARSIMNVAKQIDSDEDALKKRRDSMYVQARVWAETAVSTNPSGAWGHSVLAQAIGRLSRTKGGKERVRFAKTIYDEALAAVELDSTNDPAYHVLGAWHAEIKRLSGMTRFFAKTLFGADFMSRANWPDAEKYMKRAVALKPENIYHHLELAEVYVDVKKYDKAREQLKLVQELPISDVLDHKHKSEAADLLEEIKNKKDYT